MKTRRLTRGSCFAARWLNIGTFLEFIAVWAPSGRWTGIWGVWGQWGVGEGREGEWENSSGFLSLPSVLFCRVKAGLLVCKIEHLQIRFTFKWPGKNILVAKQSRKFLNSDKCFFHIAAYIAAEWIQTDCFKLSLIRAQNRTALYILIQLYACCCVHFFMLGLNRGHWEALIYSFVCVLLCSCAFVSVHVLLCFCMCICVCVLLSWSYR